MSSSVKNNKHPILTKSESLVSGNQGNRLRGGWGKYRIIWLWREEKGEPHKITRPISTRFNAIDGTCLSSTNVKYKGNFIKGLWKKQCDITFIIYLERGFICKALWISCYFCKKQFFSTTTVRRRNRSKKSFKLLK